MTGQAWGDDAVPGSSERRRNPPPVPGGLAVAAHDDQERALAEVEVLRRAAVDGRDVDVLHDHPARSHGCLRSSSLSSVVPSVGGLLPGAPGWPPEPSDGEHDCGCYQPPGVRMPPDGRRVGAVMQGEATELAEHGAAAVVAGRVQIASACTGLTAPLLPAEDLISSPERAIGQR